MRMIRSHSSMSYIQAHPTAAPTSGQGNAPGPTEPWTYASNLVLWCWMPCGVGCLVVLDTLWCWMPYGVACCRPLETASPSPGEVHVPQTVPWSHRSSHDAHRAPSPEASSAKESVQVILLCKGHQVPREMVQKVLFPKIWGPFQLEGTLKSHLVQLPCDEQTPTADQVLRAHASPVQIHESRWAPLRSAASFGPGPPPAVGAVLFLLMYINMKTDISANIRNDNWQK